MVETEHIRLFNSLITLIGVGVKMRWMGFLIQFQSRIDLHGIWVFRGTVEVQTRLLKNESVVEVPSMIGVCWLYLKTHLRSRPT